MKKQHLIYLLIFLVALFVRLYMIQLDPFLHDWDERFHALVARNMMNEPFKPMLNHEHLFGFDSHSWVWNEIWLHKQPLFLWQMALSMKLFGINEIALRLPSAIMGAISCSILYRVAQIVFKDNRVALFSAAMWCFSNFQLSLSSGQMGMDHNDVAFGFYVLLSVWAYFEYLQKERFKWAIAIGVFVGCAILNKWLTGLLVFAPWGLMVLVDIFKNKKKDEIKYFLVAILSCIIIFLPWQLYILNVFPAEANYEYALNTRHITEAVEGHAGPWYLYLSTTGRYFGFFLVPFLPLGIYYMSKDMNKFHAANFIMSGIVFVFFSFIVRTKIHPFVFIIAPLLVMYIAVAVIKIIEMLQLEKHYYIFLLPVIWISLNPIKIKETHFDSQPNRDRKIRNTKVYKSITSQIKPNSYLINIHENDNVEVMFYNPSIRSNNWGVDNNRIDSLLQSGKNIVVFKQNIDSMAIAKFGNHPNLTILDETIELAK